MSEDSILTNDDGPGLAQAIIESGELDIANHNDGELALDYIEHCLSLLYLPSRVECLDVLIEWIDRNVDALRADIGESFDRANALIRLAGALDRERTVIASALRVTDQFEELDFVSVMTRIERGSISEVFAIVDAIIHILQRPLFFFGENHEEIMCDPLPGFSIQQVFALAQYRDRALKDLARGKSSTDEGDSVTPPNNADSLRPHPLIESCREAQLNPLLHFIERMKLDERGRIIWTARVKDLAHLLDAVWGDDHPLAYTEPGRWRIGGELFLQKDGSPMKESTLRSNGCRLREVRPTDGQVFDLVQRCRMNINRAA